MHDTPQQRLRLIGQQQHDNNVYSAMHVNSYSTTDVFIRRRNYNGGRQHDVGIDDHVTGSITMSGTKTTSHTEFDETSYMCKLSFFAVLLFIILNLSSTIVGATISANTLSWHVRVWVFLQPFWRTIFVFTVPVPLCLTQVCFRHCNLDTVWLFLRLRHRNRTGFIDFSSKREVHC